MLPEADMLRDVELLEQYHECACDSLVRDLCCHVRALLCEVERLRPFEQAMRSLAAQFVHPTTTAEDMVRQILGAGDQEGDDRSPGKDWPP